MLSYELVLGTTVLTVMLLAGTLHYSAIVEAQAAVWYMVPLLPVGLLFAIAAVFELNRAPADLPEDEAALVAGFFVSFLRAKLRYNFQPKTHRSFGLA